MSKDYKVGYGKPPRKSQFKPGQSGNPKGRPKQAQSFAAKIDQELARKITVTEGGRSIKMSKVDAMVRSLVHKAVTKTDPRAIQTILANSTLFNKADLLSSSEQNALDRLVLAEFERNLKEGSDA